MSRKASEARTNWHRLPLRLAVIAICLAFIGALVIPMTRFGLLNTVEASDPSSSNVTVPSTPGQTVTATWSGSIPTRNILRGLAFAPAPPETVPFQGTYTDDPDPRGCGPRHSFTVPAGKLRIVVAATADVPTNDIVLNLYTTTGSRLSSDTLTSPEVVRYEPAGGVPAGAYQVEVCPFNNPTGPPTAPYTYTGTFTTDDTVVPNPAPSPTSSATATPTPTGPMPPAPAPQDSGPKIGFENFTAPGVLVPVNTTEAGQQIRSVEYMGRNAGEPSIGSNWATGVAMFKSGLETLFITFDDTCPTSGQSASWVNRQAPTSLLIDSDPIGFTDRGFTDALGFHSRTFVGELTLLSPDTVKLSYTDDDGLTWVPDQTGGLASAVDHETIGGGIYHSPIPAKPPGTAYPYAVYYCSQDIAFASCSRSDDGGLTYGASVPMYNLLTCGGLHGHVKVSPADGTVYVPNPDCGGKQTVVVSQDNGTTWAIRPTPINSPGGSGVGSDPAVGVDSNGRVYILGAAEGTVAAVATSDDFGGTWQNVFDVSAVYGLQNVAFPAAVAGSTGRAAVAFYGSTTGIGDSNADDFPGVWHLYIAHTFDGGMHWTTTDATPNAPMQRSGLLRGGGANITRNLLDFFDITIDREGRVLVGYVNGCEGGNCAQAPINTDGTSAVTGNAYTTTATIARQSSGRRLLAANDPPDVLTRTEAPGMPSVTQRRVGGVVHLAWSEADTGNSPITGYQIWRGTASGAETLLTTVPGTQTGGTYDDLTATDTKTYYYKILAVNAVGTSCGNNEIDAPYVGDYCNGIILHRNDPAHPEANLGTNTPPSLLIDYIAVGEPPSSPGNFMFKMKVNDLSTVPPNSRWRIVWNSPSSPGQQYYVGMTTGPTGPPTFQHGELADAGVPAVFVISEQTAVPALPESNFQPDGTITIFAPKSAFGNPQPGDLLGVVNGRTFTGDTPATNTLERSNLFIDHTFAKAQTDNSYPAATYTVAGNNSCSSPSTCLEDDNASIAYSSGWHLISYSNASAGHFRYHQGNSPQHSASVGFEVPAGSTGSIAYSFAKSPKGGSADIYVDGVKRQTISYAGSVGSTQAPEFKPEYQVQFGGLSGGAHTLEIKNMSGVVYVDQFCLTSSAITSNPGTGPGTTSNQSGSASAGQTASSGYQPQSGSQEMSVVVESSLNVPFKLALVNPSGLTLQTVDAVNGTAVLNAPVTQSGVYVIKVINVSLGPLQFTTTTTPLVTR